MTLKINNFGPFDITKNWAYSLERFIQTNIVYTIKIS